MKNGPLKSIILIFFLLLSGFSLFSQSERGKTLLLRGIENFRVSLYNEALKDFRDIILDPGLERFHGDAYFWIAKSYMALEQFVDAEKNLEYFLVNYKDNPNFPEAFYQKGRLFYIQGEYENSIQVFYSFIEKYENSPYIANSYYWIGESLYSMGHFDEALKIFKKVIQDYPKSFKVEAAKYRISLIELERRERELLKFLKWSHEETLKTIEEFQLREKTYEQALAAYQKKLAQLAEEGASRQIQELNAKIEEKETELKTLKERIETLKTRNEELEEKLAQALAAVPAEKKVEDFELLAPEEEELALSEKLNKKQQLLEIKEKALRLMEFYVDWLYKNLESMK
ncbi:MAG: hypothetical protein DRP87_06160 [Spirochaetes bacterium]|nr:MAG: hypothetical protein DRP87_06160 [Spirochaetota bacterium]